jgi:hypothetical protein
MLLLTGCGEEPVAGTPTIGKTCTVQFRRDALGAAMNLPVNPTTGSINGAEVMISGTIVDVTPEWIVLDSGRENLRTYVPRSVILLLDVSK